MPISPIPSTARYARQLVLAEVGHEGQARLSRARVLVVGCGGLGAPVIQYLAAAGVGHLILVDDDVVEVSNLNRQVLFSEADLGQRKAERAAAVASALHAGLRVEARVERLHGGTIQRAVREADLVVDATDGLPTKFLLNDACVLEDRPLVHGAATGFSGQVLLVPGRRGPCLRCLFEEPPPAGTVPTCRESGVLGAVTGVVGSFMAAEAVKWILGNPQTLVGRLLTVDVLTPVVRPIRFGRRASCAACGDVPSVDLRNASDYERAVCDDE